MSRNNNPPKHRNISRREFVKWDDMFNGRAAFQVVNKVMKCGSEFLNLTTKESRQRSTSVQAVSFGHTPECTDVYITHSPEGSQEMDIKEYPRVHVHVREDGTMLVVVEGGGERVTVTRRDA